MSLKGQRSHTNAPHGPAETELDSSDIRTASTQHEEGDINVRPVYKFLLWLTVGTIVVYILMYGLMKWNDHRAEQMNAEVSHVAKVASDRLPPEPRLQLAPGHAIHPLRDGRNYRDSVSGFLNSYAYINKQSGAVRISIDRAKELLLQKGLPSKVNTTTTATNVDLIPQFTNGGRTYIQRDQRIPGTAATQSQTHETTEH